MARWFILKLKSHIKTIQTDSDIFDGVMTSSFFGVTSYSNDVKTPSKMPESVWNFICDILTSKWTIVPIFTRICSAEVCFLKTSDMTSRQKWWRYNVIKHVGIHFILLTHVFRVEIFNLANFHIIRTVYAVSRQYII